MRNLFKTFVGIPESKRLLSRLRRGWDDNIYMDLRKERRRDVDWIHVDQDRDRWRGVLARKLTKKPLGFQKEGNLTG